MKDDDQICSLLEHDELNEEKNKFIIGAKNEEAHKNQEKEQLNNNNNKQKIQKRKEKIILLPLI